MPKRNVSEMSAFERLHYSLGGKTFRSIVLFSLIISIAAISFGFYLYVSSVRREYRTRTWQMAKTSVYFLDLGEVEKEAQFVIDVYDGMTPEQREQLHDKSSSLLAQFEGARAEGFEPVREILREIQESNGGIAAYIAFLDPAENRMVFVNDSDPKESFCPPGYWDTLKPSETETLIHGSTMFLDDLYGVEAIPAALIDMEPYGYRCTAGTILFEIKGYPVLVFFDTDMNQVASVSSNFFWQYVALMAATTVLVLIFAIRHIKRTVVKPINELANAADAYVKDRMDVERSSLHFNNVNIHTGDEIEKLSLALKTMETDLGEYMKNLTRVTAEKERIGAELSLATRIQAAMLPHIFPAFPDRAEFDIYASMDPAKEVGGDFYDYFLVDDDHLCMVMADVSGKGVPAALFMMASKIILQSCAMLGKSPAEILTMTNQAICSNNQEEMFVTVWVGILELSTGRLTAANAGHEYPVLKTPDGDFAIYKDKHGFVIGGMDGMKYKEYELSLTPGAKIFLYTDGVPEATDANNTLFGTERMLSALHAAQDEAPHKILKTVRAHVDAFVQEAEQFDDLTMLCVEYRGKGGAKQ